MDARKTRRLAWAGIMTLVLLSAIQCRRSGEAGRAARETAAPWTLALAAPIDHLDVVAREPMILEHPDGSLFVGGFGASRMKENRTEELTLWKSGDGGTTWARIDVGPDAPRAQGAVGNSDMDLALAPDGTVYFVTLLFDVEKYEGRQVSVGVSHDVGATWKWTLLSNTRFDDRPWVKVAPDGAAHVIWNDGAGVCHAVSQDGGTTWTERERIHPQGLSSHMAMGPSGEMAVRITPVSASGNRYDEGVDLIAVSADGGTTWRKYAAPGVRDWAALWASDKDSIPRWVEPLAWDVRGALYSLWASAGGVWLARSADQGKTWSTWHVSDGPEPAFYPYLVARGPGELAATWFSARQEAVQAHAARVDVGEGDVPPRVVESRPFEPDCWQEGRRPEDPPLRYAGGEYLAVSFLSVGGLAVVSPIENRRDKRFGFSFWKLEEHRGNPQRTDESLSKLDLADIVREHIKAVNNDDIDKNLSLFTDDAIFEPDPDTKLSGRAQVRNLMEWDVANNARLSIRDLKAKGNTVIAEIKERNEGWRLLGIDVPFTAAYEFRGRQIRRVKLEFSPESRKIFEDKFEPFAEWAKQTHPEEYQRMSEAGYSAEGARSFLSLAKEWRENQTQRASVEQELIRLENESNDAWLRRDVEAYARLLADDYLETGPDGDMATKAEELGFVRSTETTITAVITDDFKIRVYGDAAIVTFRLTFKKPVDGKEMTGQERFTDTWIKRDGRWQCVAVHYSRIAQK